MKMKKDIEIFMMQYGLVSNLAIIMPPEKNHDQSHYDCYGIAVW